MGKTKTLETIESVRRAPAAERRKERLRRRIIEVATELYIQNGGADGGFEKTTVEAIAERADISVRTFFRYFASKTDVIYLDCDRAVEALRELVNARLAREPVTAAIVGASLDQVHRFVTDPVNRTRLQRSLLAPEFKERLVVLREQQRIVLTEAMEQGVEDRPSALDASRIIASIIRATVANALDSWALDPTQDPEESIVRILDALAPIVQDLAAVGHKWRGTKSPRKQSRMR